MRAVLAPERLKPPQQQRKAPQTARGFTCTMAAYRVALPRDGESAQADFVWLLPRIHSPQQRKTPQTPRGFTCTMAAYRVALARDGESAQADFAKFQRRIHSLLVADFTNRAPMEMRSGRASLVTGGIAR